MAIEQIDKKGTAYLQGIQGLNYLGKMSGYKKPMNILKSYLKSDGKRKTLYLKFNDGELEEVVKGVYQIKINPSDKNFLNDLRDELEDNGEDIDKSKTKPGQTHHLHYHKNSILSGVFYLDPTDKSPIVFYAPKDRFYFSDENPKYWNEYNSQSWTLDVPEGNSCIIFPSQTDHSVEKNTNTEDRYSVAFNTFFKKDQRVGITATKLDI